MESKPKLTKFVFVCSRIPPSLNARLDKAVERTGLKKQAIIERGIRIVLPRLDRTKKQDSNDGDKGTVSL